MDDALVIIIFIFFSVFVIGVAFGIAFWTSRKIAYQMQEFAQRHGLQYLAPSVPLFSHPSVSGTFRKFQVSITIVKKSSGKSSVTYTVMEFSMPPDAAFPFHIYEAGFFSTLGKMFGMQDIEIGDEEFDRKFIIKCDHSDKLATLLTPALKERFHKAADQYTMWGAQCDGLKIKYEKQGAFNSPKIVGEFEDMMNLFAEIGEQLKSRR